jgi:hypothetical protein
VEDHETDTASNGKNRGEGSVIVASVTRKVVEVRREEEQESKNVEGTRHIRMMPALAMPKRDTSNQGSDGQEEPINRGRTKES